MVEAAEEEPEEYGHLVKQMERSGKVAGAYPRLEVLRQAKDLNATPPELPICVPLGGHRRKTSA